MRMASRGEMALRGARNVPRMASGGEVLSETERKRCDEFYWAV